jgi:hypothetical protein
MRDPDLVSHPHLTQGCMLTAPPVRSSAPIAAIAAGLA